MTAPQPGNLERTVLHWKNEGVDVVVSLLDEDELPGFIDAERGLCEEFGLEFVWFPIKDSSVPQSVDDFNALVAKLGDRVGTGRCVAIHCRAAIGRSAMVAACVLNYLHVDPGVALDMIAETRAKEVPQTEEQRQWVLAYSPKTASR